MRGRGLTGFAVVVDPAFAGESAQVLAEDFAADSGQRQGELVKVAGASLQLAQDQAVGTAVDELESASARTLGSLWAQAHHGDSLGTMRAVIAPSPGAVKYGAKSASRGQGSAFAHRAISGHAGSAPRSGGPVATPCR